ncbi:acetyl-CoA carboxylase, carboxyltransferase subunit beta [Ferroacidibacillus organovorans]|uniref:Acetyl-coenzyme A carboxylase carboxyl transferase subunit beta n=1 Tax=Ferroacidibacillus organovorans TaxID=1765683 RepID=A0A162UDQ3_9BACL|nr:acetyl-CoA carboxylase, carboxyltransferase subunit beta [Ferroacidibacillus organovorans]KYP81672.1 acetyl-CoA carboxylase subunit beta [Ferroacidibacillus organovorans]OAG94133.1 acetyl-CoA carboxylase carboxyl transferase subunit beta [Ferroacidibacillus organovorans]OPG15343.1 acetyl-CoA carboxylase carboxyl transferase subunit beta [Ferroacidibacillus organovorans]
MLKDLFPKKRKFATISPNQGAKDRVPEGLMNKCKRCGEILLSRELEKNVKTCPHCGYHFSMTAPERIDATLDEGSFVEFDAHLLTGDPLSFPDYPEKVQKAREMSGLDEAIVSGYGTIAGFPLYIAVMDFRFIMGSMGSVVGERLARTVERATDDGVPVVIFTVSGGARMQEGIFSLMQMAKVSAALRRHADAGRLYIAVCTNPTTGGVTASFAMQGDLNLAEPGAMIGFAGRRIIESTIRQQLPEEFQTAEFLLEHGMLDEVVHRKDMKPYLATVLAMHSKRGEPNGHRTAF